MKKPPRNRQHKSCSMPLRALRKEVVGVRIPKALLDRRDKGALGKHVENILRSTAALRHKQWAAPTQQAPDVEGVDVKTARFAPSARAPGGFRATQDLALGMLSPQALALPAEHSPVVSKSDILMVCLVEKGSHFVLVDLLAHNLSRDARVQADYRALRQGYLREVRGGHPPRKVIAGLGQGTAGAGRVCKAKTKGTGGVAPQARRRAWYARRSFVQDLARPHMAGWTAALEA